MPKAAAALLIPPDRDAVAAHGYLACLVRGGDDTWTGDVRARTPLPRNEGMLYCGPAYREGRFFLIAARVTPLAGGRLIDDVAPWFRTGLRLDEALAAFTTAGELEAWLTAQGWPGAGRFT